MNKGLLIGIFYLKVQINSISSGQQEALLRGNKQHDQARYFENYIELGGLVCLDYSDHPDQ